MANDFSGDANVQGLWTFEDYTVDTQPNIADTSGNGNSLGNAQSGGYPDADTVNNMEGSRGAYNDSASVSSFSRSDASLSADFPGKSGTTNRTFTICARIRPATITGNHVIISKWRGVTNQMSFLFRHRNVAGDDIFSAGVGYNGGANSEILNMPGMPIFVDKNYHVGVSYDSTTKDIIIRAWDVDAATAYTATTTFVETMSPDTGTFVIFSDAGFAGNFRGTVDEVVIWNRALSVAEIDWVRLGTFPDGLGGGDAGLLFGSDF